MSRAVQVRERALSQLQAQKLLSAVPYEKGFHFCTNGNYTGITATSLDEFERKLQVAPVESIPFHFKRDDFQKWLRTMIGDNELAKRIDKIKETSGENLRNAILKNVQERLAELRALLNQTI